MTEADLFSEEELSINSKSNVCTLTDSKNYMKW